MADRKYYVLCDANCKFEGMTKEQILTAIEQAVNDGEIADIDSGFVTKLKEQNKNVGLRFWVGTQAEYNALEPKPNNTFCIITDDTQKDGLFAAVEEMRAEVDGISARMGKLEIDYILDHCTPAVPADRRGYSFRKWKSGTVEHWGVEKITTALDSVWGDGYGYTKINDDGVAQVFTIRINVPTNANFARIQSCHVDVEVGGYFVFPHIVEYNLNGTVGEIKVILWSPAPITEEIEIKLHYSARGMWR